jgi:hypothetical protein
VESALTLEPSVTLQFVTIEESEEGELRVVLVEAMPDGPPEFVVSFGFEAVPVRPTAQSRMFELVWHDYAAYLVTAESYATPEDGLVGPGLTIATSSRLIDFIATTTIAPAILGPLQHWRLVSISHVIDVVGVSAPAIRQLS